MKLLSKLFLALAVLLVLLVALAFGCVYLLESVGPGMAAQKLNAMTGFRLEVSKFRLSLIHSSVDIEGLRLRNPEGWPEDDFVTVNALRTGVHPLSFVGSSRREIDEAVIDLGTINVVRDSQGRINAQEFAARLNEAAAEKPGAKKGETPPAEAPAKAQTAPTEFIVHHLVLKAGKLRYADYSGNRARVSERNIALNVDMREVTSTREIQNVVTAQIAPQVLLMLGSVQMQLGGDKLEDAGSIPARIPAQLGNLLDEIGKKKKK